jgi:hypothetical protein
MKPPPLDEGIINKLRACLAAAADEQVVVVMDDN